MYNKRVKMTEKARKQREKDIYGMKVKGSGQKNVPLLAERNAGSSYVADQALPAEPNTSLHLCM